MGPPLALAIGIIARTVDHYSLVVTPDWVWSSLGPFVTLGLTVFIGDFTSYWRHRLEHTRWLWPTHAIHHSDTEMTWLTGNRFHPGEPAGDNRRRQHLSWLLIGAPPWAIAVNELIRHYYGEFVHADVPWTYGPFGAIFVSPAMHRWHHARDVTGAGSNFATVFSIFDRALRDAVAFQDLRDVPLGVTDDIGRGALRQPRYPFRSWGDRRVGAGRAGARARRGPCAGQHMTRALMRKDRGRTGS